MGHVGDRNAAPRQRHRAAHQGRRQRALGDQPRARHRQVRQAGMRRTRRSPVRATARAAASTATSATSCRQPRHRQSRASGPHRLGVGLDESEMPRKGIPALEIIEAIHAGEIKGLLSICFNPAVGPRHQFHRRGPRPPRVLRRHRLLPVRDRASRRRRAAGLAARGGRRYVDERRGTNHQDQRRRDPPGDARRDWEILLDIARPARRGEYFPYTTTEQIFEELRVASSGGTADYAGATWQRIEDEMGLFWPIPEVGHPGTPRLYEGGRFYHPDGKARFTRRPVQGVGRGRRRRLPDVADDRAGGQPVPLGTQTRRIAGLVEQYPEPLCEMHPRLAEQTRRRRRRPRHRHLASRRDHPAGQCRDDDPSGHGVHPLPLARRTRRPTS